MDKDSTPPKIALRDFQSVVKKDLEEFSHHFKEAVKVEHGLLNMVVRYFLRQKGKRIRPLLVLLTAKTCGGVRERSYRAAALVELLHTATLVHDDVVDESEKRRGVFSINALWGNKVAVLLGDYFLSRGLLLALDHDDFDLLRVLSNAVKRMSEGELRQVQRARSMDVDEASYYKIISDKTASLISACTRCGALSADADPESLQSMGEFGEQLGLAFQIRDDLFDYGTQEVGKPTGADIQKKLVTLPLIHALEVADSSDRQRILNIIRKGRKSRQNRQTIYEFVESTGGLLYAQQRMEEHVKSAQSLLRSFPESESRRAMHALSQYVITRKK
ncbi:MAG: polyprenyl synthetase family protein [Bacteroidetes bacterium]|nr:polyprenyl synthetase family protein [Bacteroidota bacterium]